MINFPKQRWRQHEPAQEACAKIAAAFNLLPETARIIVNRGLTDVDAVQTFLEPTLKQLIAPEAMLGMKGAVERIVAAIDQGQRILIHGDYDADGVTSTAVLFRFFRELNIDVDVYIPNRLEESHGLNPGVLELTKSKKIDLVITCDCGIGSAKIIQELHQQGVETIVTDHHQVPTEGPPQNAIVLNPAQLECDFGDDYMTGVGIAFYLIIGVRAKLRDQGFFSDGLPEPKLNAYLDLVALGTIADVAPLLGQNRIFVKEGLRQLQKTNKVGLRVLLNLSLNADRAYTATDIAFYVAPKINAAGRLGHADDAFALLVADDPVRAAVLGRKLMNYTQQRRDIESKQLREAIDAGEKLLKQHDYRVLVVANPQWHLGVAGLTAQRLLERFERPVIVLGSVQGSVGEEGQEAGVGKEGRLLLKGSVRSLEGINILHYLNKAASVLNTFGGHARAAGVSLYEENLEEFRKILDEAMRADDCQAAAESVYVDGTISIDAINERLIDELERLKPFGQGNPEPIFQCEQVRPVDVRRIGEKKEHVRLSLVGDQGAKVSAVGFKLAGSMPAKAEALDVLVTPEYNWWQGRRSIQARVRAIDSNQ